MGKVPRLGGPRERLAESGPREVGVQVSRCDLAKVQKKEALRKDKSGNWKDASPAVPAKGRSAAGGQSDVGPYPYAAERATEVQHRNDDGVPEGKEWRWCMNAS